MRKRRLLIGLFLFFLMLGVYTLLYQGQLLFSDERTLFDSAQSFVRRGELSPTYEYDVYARLAVGDSPWSPPAHEPLPIYVVAFFTWIGSLIPEIGLIHTALFMNIFLMALTVVSFYAFALAMGYSVRTAVVASLLLGLATNILPYGRTLFREPLMTLFFFWCFGFAILFRRGIVRDGRFSLLFFMGIIVTAILAILSKVVAVFFIAGIAIVLWPSAQTLKHYRRQAIVLFLVGIGVLIAGVLVSSSPLLENTRYSWDRWGVYLQNSTGSAVIEAILGYHFSWGRSIWLYSPILIIAAWGGWRLWRRGEWRIVLAPLLMIVFASVFYGLIHQNVWWGGWGWGPRYFTSVIPLMMIWLLPVIEARRNLLQNVIVFVFIALSVLMQVIGVLVPLSNYYTERHLSGHAVFGTAEPWMAINWSWELGPIAYHIEHLNPANYDGAWHVVERGAEVALILVLLIAVAGGGLTLILRGHMHKIVNRGLLMSCVVLFGIGVALGLHNLRDDPRIIGEYADVDQLVDALNEVVDDHAAVFIDQPLYTQLFMNWLKVADLAVTLDYAPGEFYGDTASVVVSDDPVMRMGQENYEALDWSAAHYPQVWLVASSSPFDPTKNRPIEHYLVEHYFPVREIGTSPRARAIQFLTVEAPEGAPENIVEAEFGEQVSLQGYDLPLGTSYSAAQVIPVSLAWEVNQEPEFDYNVSIYLTDETGVVVTQRDAQPQGTFGYMSRWQMGEVYRDNHGLQLPENLPAGTYSLHLVVYNWQTQARLDALDATNEPIGDSLLLETITVQR